MGSCKDFRIRIQAEILVLFICDPGQIKMPEPQLYPLQNVALSLDPIQLLREGNEVRGDRSWLGQGQHVEPAFFKS